MCLQPGALRHGHVQEFVAKMDYQAKDGPHAERPSDQQTHQQHRVVPLTCEAVKQRHQRQARGQHHGYNHQRLTHDNDQYYKAVTEVGTAQGWLYS
jgi:hypothetical protein